MACLGSNSSYSNTGLAVVACRSSSSNISCNTGLATVACRGSGSGSSNDLAVVACRGSSSNSSNGLAAVGLLTSTNVGPMLSFPPGRRDNSNRCSKRHESLRSEVTGRTEVVPYPIFFGGNGGAVQKWFQSENVKMPMFSLLKGPQQSAPTAVALAAAAPAAEAMTGTRVFPDVSSEGVAEAPTSSTGAAPAAETVAAPATGGTVFPTASVGGEARAPAPSDETAASKAAPTTSGTVPSATPLRGQLGCASRLLERRQRTLQRRRHRRPAHLLPLMRRWRGRLENSR